MCVCVSLPFPLISFSAIFHWFPITHRPNEIPKRSIENFERKNANKNNIFVSGQDMHTLSTKLKSITIVWLQLDNRGGKKSSNSIRRSTHGDNGHDRRWKRKWVDGQRANDEDVDRRKRWAKKMKNKKTIKKSPQEQFLLNPITLCTIYVCIMCVCDNTLPFHFYY